MKRSAIPQIEVDGKLIPVSIKSRTDMIYLDDGTTLDSKLNNIDETLDSKLSNSDVSKFIDDAVNSIIDGAPESYDTLKEIADYIKNNDECISLINEAILNKVNKEEGKGLSSNDFTDILKTKLQNLNNTWRGIVDHLNSTDTEVSLSANQGRIINEKLTDYIKKNITDQTGVHGIRYYNETLSYQNSDGDWKEITVGTSKKIYLNTPSNVVVSTGDESVSLSWTDPEDAIIEGAIFAMWESTSVVRKAGSAPTNINDGEIVLSYKERNKYKDTSFVDTGLTNGITYYYGIFPRSTESNYTTSFTISATPNAIYPEAAQILSITAGDEEAKLTFTLPDNITSYKLVYKANSAPIASNDGKEIENYVSGSTINRLNNDVTYYFAIFTYNDKGRETMSSILNCTPKVIYPSAASGISVTGGDEFAKLSFSVAGDVVSYKVVYKANTTIDGISDGTLIEDYKSGDDIPLSNNITYYFAIFTYNSKGRETMSTIVNYTPREVYPNVATNISVATDKINKTATVSFALPSDASYANVVMKKGSEPTSSTDGTVQSNLTVGTASFDSLEYDNTYYFKVYTYNNKNRETPSKYVSVLFEIKIVSFASATSTELAEMLNAHYNGDIDISDYWSIGDSRIISLSEMSNSNYWATVPTQKVTINIIAINHDILKNKISTRDKAAITVQCKEVLGDGAGDSSLLYFDGTNESGPSNNYDNYYDSNMCIWCNQTFYNAIDSSIKSLIKCVYKDCADGHNTTSMTEKELYAWLLSEYEVYGELYNSGCKAQEGTQYKYYETESNRIKNVNNNGSIIENAKQWWLRSPASDVSGSQYRWGSVSNLGNYNTVSCVSNSLPIAPAFCL